MWHLGNESRHHGLVGGARPRGRPARPVWRHTVHARPAGCCRHLVRPLGDRTGVDGLDTCGGGMADAAHHHTAPGGNGREAASAGGPSEPPPTLIRRSRRVSPPFAAGFCNLRPRWLRKGRTKRRGGNDRSDAERLPTRFKPSKGQRCENPGRPPLLRERGRPAARREHFGVRRLAVVKRSEPHVRYRDATSPDPAVRSKPSRWCETTRTEQDRRGVAATARRPVALGHELVS
jgi:hypothetical protein